MTKAQKLEAYKMRLEGMTLQSIADKFGVTREYIRQITPLAGPSHRTGYAFPNIAKWLHTEGIYNYEFADMLGVSGATLGSWLLGKTEPSLYAIRKIIEVTGMPFEVAFAVEEKQDGNG